MDQEPVRPTTGATTANPNNISSRPVVRGPEAGVIKRLFLLCLKPECWADMARFPLRYTVGTVILAVIVAGIITGVATARSFLREATQFAVKYDARFAPLTFVGDKLTAPAGTPIDKMPRFVINETKWVIDPTGLTKIEQLPEGSVLMSADTVQIKSGFGVMNADIWFTAIRQATKDLGITGQINSTSLKNALRDFGTTVAFFFGVGVTFQSAILGMLWAVVIAFLTAPLVRIATPNLRMPRMMAYRISGSVTVPLLILGAILELIGHSPRQVFGPEWSPLIWFFAAVILSFWAGVMLNRHALEAMRRHKGQGE